VKEVKVNYQSPSNVALGYMMKVQLHYDKLFDELETIASDGMVDTFIIQWRLICGRQSKDRFELCSEWRGAFIKSGPTKIESV
jgi:hypothetical protein